MSFAVNSAGNSVPNGRASGNLPMRTLMAISSKLMGETQRMLAVF